jgi:hypothetical protein
MTTTTLVPAMLSKSTLKNRSVALPLIGEPVAIRIAMEPVRAALLAFTACFPFLLVAQLLSGISGADHRRSHGPGNN